MTPSNRQILLRSWVLGGPLARRLVPFDTRKGPRKPRPRACRTIQCVSRMAGCKDYKNLLARIAFLRGRVDDIMIDDIQAFKDIRPDSGFM